MSGLGTDEDKAGAPMEVVLVVAAADNGVIGADGRIPWSLPADLRRFRRLTMGKPLLMGRKTFESIGRPLPGRTNIVLSGAAGWRADGVRLAHSLADGLAIARSEGQVLMVIGGADLYRQTLPLAHRIELTRVHVSPPGDRLFPAPDPALWRLSGREDLPAAGEAPACSFLSYVRVGG